MKTVNTLLVCLLFPAMAAFAADNPITTYQKGVYRGTKQILLRSAEQVAEENYSFKPTPEVRSYGQIIGHVADAQYIFCSIVLGEKNPSPDVEKTKTTKADLIASLKDAFAYCDKAYESINDASGSELVKFHGSDAPKLGVMMVNNVHTIEHYGNLVTYMRLKNIVPPTSDQAFMKTLMK